MVKRSSHKEQVERLARLASVRSEEVVQHRTAVREWTARTLGTPEGLAWSFAAGALIGASRRPRENTAGGSSAIARTAKLSWLVWPYLSSLAASDDAAATTAEPAADFS